MKIAIIGAAELGKLIASHAVNDSNFTVAGYYDDFNRDKTFNNYPLLGNSSTIVNDYTAKKFDAVIMGIGYSRMNSRAEIFEKLKGHVPFCNVIHSSAYVDSTCKLGEGIFILPGVVLDLDVIIEDNVLLNTGVIIAHHTTVKKHTFIAPGVNVAGLVEIGERCFIGIGAIIKDCLQIAKSSIIGAGSLVLENTEENSVSVGSPSRIIKYQNK